MKSIIVIATLMLAACNEPISQSEWVKRSESLQQVKGFEDCVMSDVQRVTNANIITLVRCPNSTATTFQRVGKSGTSETAVVELTPADKVKALEQIILSQNEMLEKQRLMIQNIIEVVKSKNQ